jgi:hypothetical protein
MRLSSSLHRTTRTPGLALAFALFLLVPSCGSDEDGAISGGAGGTTTGGSATGGAGTGTGGTNGTGSGGASGSAGAGGSAAASGSAGAGAGGSAGARGSAGANGTAGSGAGTGATSGTGGAAGSDGGRTDAGNADAAACGGLGAGCDVSCQPNFECERGVCIPNGRPTCGGFAGMECPQGFPVCMYCNGCDFGPCFRENEIACLCRGVGQTVFRCSDR